MEPLIVFVVLGAVAAACAIVVFSIRIDKNSTERWMQQMQEHRETEARKQSLEIQAGIAAWLMGLGLPRVATQRQAQEAARQLSIVLIEKLTRRPSFLQHPTAHLKTTKLPQHSPKQSGSKAMSQRQTQQRRQ